MLFVYYLLQKLIIKVRRIYVIFWSGSSHKPHAQFMSQASLYNNGRSLGLLCGADTRMASFFYSMHRCLRQRRALLATIHSSLWESVELNQRIRKAIRDIENDDFWKALYTVLHITMCLARTTCTSTG